MTHEQPTDRGERRRRTVGATGDARSSERRSPAPAPLAQWVGHTRFIVLLAVGAVLLIAAALFLVASWLAVLGVWHAGEDALRGRLDSTDITVEFLEVISTLLKAVVFYLVGVGLYSLFIGPLNLTTALGVETLADLERKIVSIVILILAVTLLEHFIRWEDPRETLWFGATLALVVTALVGFQFVSLRGERELYTPGPEAQARAQRALYTGDREEREVTADEVEAAGDDARRTPGEVARGSDS
jgi:uncharacterized membrane protein YqhA